MLELDKKRRLVEELLSHLDTSQGGDLGKMIEAAKAPKDMDAFDKPKGVSIEKIDIMKPKDDLEIEGSPEEEKAESPEEEKSEDEIPGLEAKGDDESLSDEELAEMLKKYLGE